MERPRIASRGPGWVVPPTFIFLGIFVAAVAIDTWRPWSMALSEPEAWLAGFGLVLIGSGIFVAGLVTFARARTGIMLQQPATRLVTHGPYRWSRNPQYVSFVVVYAGATVVANSFWPWIVLPVVIVATNAFVIAREERYMQTLFSREYEAYCRQAPRWI